MMKARSLLAALALPALAPALAAQDLQALQQEAASLIPPFQQELLGTVKQAIATGGPAAAVEACQLLAPEIAARHSEQPWQVGRTALKIRNPDNAPDAWERGVLEAFAARAAAGEPVAELRHGEIVDGRYRYMQAIATGEPCLACHGKAIKPELARVIDSRYPDDAARGFEPGQLRGAFSLSREVTP